jgi:hypothetical protein
VLVIPRKDLAINLASYGEHEASARIREMSDAAYQRVCQIGFKYALTGMQLMKAGCLAAIEVMEGAPRELRRQRRDWTDVPPGMLERDPIAVEVEKHIDRYASGARVGKKEIVDSLSRALAPVLQDFQYYRTAKEFRGPFNDGTSYITLEYAKGDVAIRFGVHHERIESLKHRLFGLAMSASSAFPTTISKYSYNMGPRSPHWSYPTETTWPISGSHGLKLASKEVKSFVVETVLPYVLMHREMLAIRNTLLHEPGRADTWSSVDATVFAIDFLCRKREWVTQDYELLRERYANFVQERRDELDARYTTVTARWDDDAI